MIIKGRTDETPKLKTSPEVKPKKKGWFNWINWQLQNIEKIKVNKKFYKYIKIKNYSLLTSVGIEKPYSGKTWI